MNDAGGARLWVVLARAYDAVSAFIQQSIASTGLGLSDFMVLEVLLHKGPLPISEISPRVLLAAASMTSAADRLERRGLVERQLSCTDRRVRILALTGDGRKLIETVYAGHAAEIEALTGALTGDEQTQLHGLLKKLGYAARDAAKSRTRNRKGDAIDI